MELKALQNGSDIRGIAIAIPGGKPVDLSEKAAYAIGRALVRLLRKRLGKSELKILAGRDSRLSGPSLCRAIEAGIAAEGARSFDAGLATTPAMFMATVTEGFLFDASVMTTASHLPYERNGFKFFSAKGGFEKDDIAELLKTAETIPDEDMALICSAAEKVDFMPVYAKQLVDAIRRGTGEEKPLEGMRIIIDAGNGAGGFFEKEVLKKLGADTDGSLLPSRTAVSPTMRQIPRTRVQWRI